MADTTLQDAIGEAAAELQEQINEQEKEEGKGKESSEGVVENEEEEEPGRELEEAEENTEGNEEEVTEEDDKQAQKESLLLYNALKDPKLRGPVILALAQEAGLNFNPPTTKVEEKKQEKAIRELVAETLGPEYKFLADKLGTVIEEVVGRLESQNNETRLEQQQQQILRETNETLAKLAKETKGESRKLEAKMVQLMDKFPSGPNTSVDEYIRGIYSLASGGRVAQTTKTQIADKIRNNSKNAPERLRSAGASETGKEPEFRGKGALKKAVEFAAEQLESQGKLFRKR